MRGGRFDDLGDPDADPAAGADPALTTGAGERPAIGADGAGPAPRPEVCVGAIAVDSGRLLLIRRGRGAAQGRWSVPGGRVEHGETLAEAVVREVSEETGVEAVCDGLVGWVEIFDGPDHYVVLDFAVTVLSASEPVAGDDAAQAAWVPLEEVTDLALTDGLAEFLHDHGILTTIV